MPLHYNGRTYQSFNSTVAAVHRKHPTWSLERCRKYVGGLQKKQEKPRRGPKRTLNQLKGLKKLSKVKGLTAKQKRYLHEAGVIAISSVGAVVTPLLFERWRIRRLYGKPKESKYETWLRTAK